MSTFKNIPPEIARILRGSIRRIRSIILLRGIFTMVTVAAIFMLVSWGMFAAIDDIARWVRWIFWGVSVGAVATTAWVSLLRPLLRRYAPWEIAAFIERNHPELDERLSSVVGLASVAGDADVSSRLIEELTHAAVRDAGKVSPRHEISMRSMVPWLVAVVVAGSLIAGIALVFPKFAANAFVFAALPGSEVDNVYASAISVQPGDAIALAGEPFTVKMVAEGRLLSKAFIRMRIGGGAESVERMEKESGDAEDRASFTYTYPRADRDFTYRVKCGGGLTRAFNVRVVPEPAFSARAIEIHHPAYTVRAPDRYTNTAAVVGLPGSTVRVTFRPSAPDLEGAAVLPGARTVPATRTEDGLMAVEFLLDRECEGSWGLRVWDANGFSNQLETASITLVKDAAPTIRLIQPEVLEMKLPAFGELPLAYEIQEDFGLSSTVLEMCAGAGAWEECETLAPRRTGGVRWSDETVVHFAGKNFGNAGVVRFRVKASDTLPETMGGPGTVYSPEITVTLVSQNTSLARQSLAQQIAEGRAELDAIRRKLESAKRCLESSSHHFKGADNVNHEREARNNLNWAKSGMTAAEGLLATFIANLADSRLETGADLFRPVLSGHFTPTRQEIEDVYLQSRNPQKAESCGRAATSVQTCLSELDKARRRYEALTKAAEKLQKLADYAAREEALAEMYAKNEIDAQELAEREEALAKRFGEDFREELRGNLDWQKKVTEDMRQKTSQLERRQTELQEKAAAAQSEDARAAVAREEEGLAKEIRDHANRLAGLEREIEQRVGPVEDDPTATAQPMKDACADEYKAAQTANAAAEKMKNGDAAGAQEDMQSVTDALRKAQQDLTAARERLETKGRELAANRQDYSAMQQSLDAAVSAAKAAAEEAAKPQSGDQQQSSQPQSDGQQQPGQPQPDGQQQPGQPQPDGQQQPGQPQPDGQQQPGQPQPDGQQQPGQPQPDGQQQPGQPQDPPEPSAAQQTAQQTARQTAAKMQQKAQQTARQHNLPMDRFQPADDSVSEGPSDPHGTGTSQGPQMPQKGGPLLPPGEESEDGSDWFKMKSETATGADTDTLDDVPQEYRGLVRDYFEALNEGGKK
ncbi:MAG: hypothetical protein ACI4R9_02830 [Kiritimatiellia bacterium]